MEENNKQKRLAVLIDADNAQPSIIEAVLEEVANLGIASVKRIYGDWTSPNLKSWKELVLEYSIQPHQQFAYTTGKNATDSALIIDAMDLLYSGSLDGFCIVSSDSDFTRLSSRLQGIGEDGVRFRREENTRGLRRRLRPVHLHRKSAKHQRPSPKTGKSPGCPPIC
jgi:hypothetical protein